ncbi:hypothetical protein OG884_04085 [Streptosporangium sp. NBC_01755]|uniref:DUF6879 family protein n=1 Tax=unclassified Streptosporangium TaxID=2632669 RepID=UPI002DDC62B9|nr:MULTISPECIES: DUF6879 family protein [unclassified Streptosporangium]WSA27322.1 hypothetical protein OIE13_05450 [Streptosporangium sp. NBC_01810]WSD01126.1 hypothetical protein OG884_04085 [Streptosporangium sp. NBC_01755]
MASDIRDGLRTARSSAVHLELRDVYTPNDPDYLAWMAGDRFDPAERWSDWFDLIVATVARGVRVRRARIVSEPVTDYIRYEYDITAAHNIAAGEEVRWLPRRQAADLLVPGSDLWIFDGSVVVFNHFTGDGTWPADGVERRADEALAKRLLAAFDTIWERATPHQDYQPT